MKEVVKTNNSFRKQNEIVLQRIKIKIKKSKEDEENFENAKNRCVNKFSLSTVNTIPFHLY